jgi:hypothetical protein
MSSNGVMLQDYVPNAINNLTEEIWCAGAVIPRGKRVVIGHNRDGWQEVTFTMGPMEDFIGMALVPPEMIAIEEPKRIPGVGFMPQGVAAMAVRSQQYGPRSPAIDQSAPLPSPPGGSSAFTSSMLPGCYMVTGTVVAVRDQAGQNANVLAWANPGDMYYADGVRVYDSHVLLGQHTVVSGFWVRVIPWAWHISPGNRPSGAMWIFEKYLQPCSSTAQPPVQSASQAYTSALREQALPANQSHAPRSRGRPYQWGGLHGHGVGDVPEELPEGWPESASPGTGIAIPSYVPGQARPGESRGIYPYYMPQTSAFTRGQAHGITSWGVRRAGLSAGGASAFTMTAANALNQELVTNNCAGCADMTSRLRQLTFAFKAAVATDTGMPAQNLNMSNMLAMTAYGPATDAALKLVLGAGTAYANGPCTDDNGNCLGNFATPITPQTIQAVEQQFAQQIQTLLGQVNNLPQADIVHMLVQGFSTLVTQFAAELAKVKPVVFNPPPAVPPPAAPPATAPATGIPWSTVLLGGLIGTAVIGTGVLLYAHTRHA